MTKIGFTTAEQTNIAICEALGLDPKLVYSLRLRVDVGAVARLDVCYYLTNEQGEKIDEALKTFELIPKNTKRSKK